MEHVKVSQVGQAFNNNLCCKEVLGRIYKLHPLISQTSVVVGIARGKLVQEKLPGLSANFKTQLSLGNLKGNTKRRVAVSEF